MSIGYYNAYLRGDLNKEYLIKALDNGIIFAFDDAMNIFSLEELEK